MAFPDGWGRRCALTIDNTYVDSDLTDWTYVLKKDAGVGAESVLPSEMFDADGSYPALEGGGDIRFSSNSDGTTQLPCDIRAFHVDNDPDNGYADIAVKVPTVNSGSTTTIYIWYNAAGESQPAASDTYGQYNAYDANYIAVYSLNEDPAAAGAGDIKNRKADANHGTAEASMTSADLVNAKIYKGHDYDGTDDYVDIGTGLNASLDSGFTIEAVINPTSVSSVHPIAANYDGDAVVTSRHGFNFHMLDDELRLTRLEGDSGGVVYIGRVTTGNEISVSTWYHVACTWDGTYADSTGIDLYIDGVATDDADSASGTVTSISTPAQNLWIAGLQNQSSTSNFEGVLDELRFSTSVRAAAWLKAVYNNLLNATSFTTVGTPENVGSIISGIPTTGKSSTIQLGI